MATEVVWSLLGLLCLLQVKHFLADYVLQSPFILDHRKMYGHPGGLLHVGIHMLGSWLAFMVVGGDLLIRLLLVLGEGIFHYHADWLKDNFLARHKLTSQDKTFWIVSGLDQAAHQLSYLVIAGVWLYLEHLPH